MPYIEYSISTEEQAPRKQAYKRKQPHLIVKLLNQNFSNEKMVEIEYEPTVKENLTESKIKLNQYLSRLAKAWR